MPDTSTSLLQQRDAPPPRLLAGYISGSPDHPEEAGGDFVIGTDDASGGYTISSAVGAHPWYYTVTSKGLLLQGSNVFDLCAAAGFAWEWNDVAIAQLALLGHTIGLHTLHPRIYRMPSDARLEFRDGKLTTTRLSPFSSWRWDEDELDESFASLKQAFEDCLSGEDQPILSLSGGYDSRLLLALCHWKGLKPHLFVSGTPDTSDRKIATLAAELMELPIECIVLKADDYLRHGEEISHATSGVKMVEHWHTWHYSRQLNDKNKLHLVGSNGEFARTYYNDWLSRSRVLRCLGLGGLRGYLLARMFSRARRYSRHHALSVFASIPSVLHSLETDVATYPSSFLPALDTFYATERVRHFIGSGIACYAEFTRPRSPFLDRSWMRSVAAVKRQWKEDDRYHRMATEALASPLARIPYNCDPDGGPPRKHSAFNDLVHLTSTRDFIIESDQLDYFLPRADRIKIFSGGANRFADICFLLTMHFAALNASAASGGLTQDARSPTQESGDNHFA